MFYEGSLQEAIQAALTASKLVVCFVTDDGPESIRWEAEFLTDDAIKDKLANQAVSLRLEAGSQEAGYLEALFPVPRKPTMVMIHNGALKEYIAPGLAKQDFIQRTLKALGYASPAAPDNALTPQSTTATSSSTAPNTTQADQDDEDDLYGDSAAQPSAAPVAASHEATSSEPTPSPEQVRTTAMLAERAKRLEADKKSKDAKEKAAREARSKARKESSATDASTSSTNTNTTATTHDIKPAERKHAQEVRQQKILDREHRLRILKRIEDDRRERKERDAQEKQARLLLNATEEGDASLSSAQIPLTTRLTESSSKATSKDGKGAETIKFCAVQVRLFDGSVIRARFPSDSTLEKDVRGWIDEDRTDEGGRYTFRHVLTPLPNKAISSDEEKDKTLQDLGMSPSATLVLVPVSFATAYHENPRGDVLGRALWPIVYLLRSGWRMLSGFLGLLFGGGSGRDDGGARAMGLEPTRATTTSSKRRDEEGVELKERGKKKEKKTGEGKQNYDNGNSLSFEPRHDDSENE